MGVKNLENTDGQVDIKKLATLVKFAKNALL